MAKGYGYWNGLPFYEINGNIQTPVFEIPAGAFGDYSAGEQGVFKYEKDTSTRTTVGLYAPFQSGGRGYFYNGDSPQCGFIAINRESIRTYYPNAVSGQIGQGRVALLENKPLSLIMFRIVPAEESDIPDDYGLSLKIP